MPTLFYQGRLIEARSTESVLEAFMRQSAESAFSCRKGACHACLMRCTRGTVPAAAQRGLSPDLRAANYFLPCLCIAQDDMEIADPRPVDLYTRAEVLAKDLLAKDVCRLRLGPHRELSYRAGQFINLRRADGTARCYSLASAPYENDALELHVKRMPGGTMSNWIFDELAVGAELHIQGPLGASCYEGVPAQQNLLLLATGTGVAPLAAIAREALAHGHEGAIHLYHGTRSVAGIYLDEQMQALEDLHPNFYFHACVSGPHAPRHTLAGRCDDVAFARHGNLTGWRVHLAGLPAMVQSAADRAVRLGAQRADIFSDPFESYSRHVPMPEECSESAAMSMPPDPELWDAIGGSEGLLATLQDFYGQAFEDERLAPFFHNITQQRAIDKQLLFMRRMITGERVYFGDRPRNAHHWMVVSDELFDYRESLLMASLRRRGVPEPMIRRWRAIDERFRPHIVKTAPWPRHIGDIELPLDGFGEETLEVGSLCDACGGPIQAGARVRYHLRLGSTYCASCAPQPTGALDP